MRYLLSMLLLLSLSISAIAQKTHEFHLNESYSITTGGVIHLESNDADVTITGSDRNDVYVKVDYRLEVRGMTFGDNDKFRMEVRESSDGLRIREVSGATNIRGIVGSIKEDYKIRLEVPYHAQLDIEGDDDDYNISGIDGDIKLSAEDGDIRIQNSKSKKTQIFVDDADINIYDGQGKLRLRGEDCDIKIKNGDYSAIDLDVDDSNVELETRLANHGKYQLEGADGDFNISFLSGGGEIWIKHDDGSLITNGSFEIREHGDHNKRLRLEGGNAQIRIRLDDGDLILNTM